jgi:DNA repair protein RecO (recombination protein O)
VSPKSGRAVSRAAAAPYLDRLLVLPAFVVAEADASTSDVAGAFRLTGHFLDMHVWMPRQVDPPATRDRLIALVTEGGPEPAPDQIKG